MVQLICYWNSSQSQILERLNFDSEPLYLRKFMSYQTHSSNPLTLSSTTESDLNLFFFSSTSRFNPLPGSSDEKNLTEAPENDNFGAFPKKEFLYKANTRINLITFPWCNRVIKVYYWQMLISHNDPRVKLTLLNRPRLG